MKRHHMPRVAPRYWTAITLASIFGTNLGDLYAHESGLGIGSGLIVLAALAVATFAVERKDRAPHELYYWLVIIIIRTGATNIADYLAFRVRIPGLVLVLGLAGLLAILAWRSTRTGVDRTGSAPGALPDTGAVYWLAMLVAGVFGTVSGDIASHLVGQGVASIGLGVVLAIVLVTWRGGARGAIGTYWLTVAVARTTGTAIGDWIAENEGMHLGLPVATLATGLAFIAVLVLWRTRRPVAVTA